MILKRPNKGPVQVYILLLEEAVVLLQREGEKYLLKFFQTGAATQQPLSPIIKMNTLLFRANAVCKLLFIPLFSFQVITNLFFSKNFPLYCKYIIK